MTLEEVGKNSFIYEIRDALTDEICQDMIARFEANVEQQYSGRMGQVAAVDENIKISTDLRISGRTDWRSIDELLQKSLSNALGQLCVIHPFFSTNHFKDIGYNMQRTLPGEYYHWHIDSGPGEFTGRQLVAIWYLNDVQVPGGETDFYHQNISVIPERGKLILFPPFWTHLHRGAALKQGVKYIATTWVCFT